LKTFDHLTVVGLREWVALPDLGVAGLRAKIDTGASTSSLHATDIEPFERDGEQWVRFTAHLGTVVQLRHRRCEAPLVTMKTIKSSNGHAQMRYVVSTTLALGDRVWRVEFTLACRKSMRYRLLLGSKALIDGQLVVNPGIKYVQDKPVFPVSVLSRNPRLYSTRRLVEAGTERGHEMVVIDTLRAYMNIASHKPQIHYRGKPLEGFDAVIPRIGASVTFYGCAVLRQFEMMGVFPLNESVAIARSRDKLRSLQLLSRRGIGLPVTGFAHSPDDIPDLIEMVNGAPLVIKVLEGTQGIGVVMCETATAAESVIEAFMGLKQNIMVQEYIKEAGGADIRCFVVGDKVIAAMKRQAKPGEFRSNLHRGGTASLIKITPEERMTALRAAKVMGLAVAGVDILRSNHGPLVMEVNSSPGLEGIETTTNKNVAGIIIEHLEKNGGPNMTRTKGKG
jgi:ribosomal protein S6--L-glutamate ligase